MALNSKQHAFAQEYLIDRNATQAAIRAGYSARTAYQQGHMLLKHPEVQQAIQDGTIKHSAAVGITAESVLADIARIAELAEHVGEFGAALKGRELLGRNLKLFTDKVELTGKLTLEQLVDAAAARSKE